MPKKRTYPLHRPHWVQRRYSRTLYLGLRWAFSIKHCLAILSPAVPRRFARLTHFAGGYFVVFFGQFNPNLGLYPTLAYVEKHLWARAAVHSTSFRSLLCLPLPTKCRNFLRLATGYVGRRVPMRRGTHSGVWYPTVSTCAGGEIGRRTTLRW